MASFEIKLTSGYTDYFILEKDGNLYLRHHYNDHRQSCIDELDIDTLLGSLIQNLFGDTKNLMVTINGRQQSAYNLEDLKKSVRVLQAVAKSNRVLPKKVEPVLQPQQKPRSAVDTRLYEIEDYNYKQTYRIYGESKDGKTSMSLRILRRQEGYYAYITYYSPEFSFYEVICHKHSIVEFFEALKKITSYTYESVVIDFKEYTNKESKVSCYNILVGSLITIIDLGTQVDKAEAFKMPM